MRYVLARHYIHPSCKQDVELEVWKAMSTLFFSIFYSFFKRKKSPNIYNCKHDVLILLFGSLCVASLRVNVLKGLLRKAVSPIWLVFPHTHGQTEKKKKFLQPFQLRRYKWLPPPTSKQAAPVKQASSSEAKRSVRANGTAPQSSAFLYT